MPDLESRMPDLLRRAAGGPPRDPELERRILRRARRRRVLNASVAGVAVVVLVSGLVVGVRTFAPDDRRVPGDRSPEESVSSLDAVWPETTATALAEAQSRANQGMLDWRLDPVETAVAFATEVLDWDASDVDAGTPRSQVAGETPPGGVRVTISNRGLTSGIGAASQPAPQTVLTLDRLGTQGDGGVWSVTEARSDHVDLSTRDAGSRTISGRLVETIPEWTPGVWLVVDGDRSDNILDLLGPDGEGTITPLESFTVDVPANAAPAGSVIGVVVFLWDPEGTLVTGEAFPYIVPESPAVSPTDPTAPSDATGPSGATGATVDAPAAAATHDAVLEAARALDFDALETLIDPDHFAYNFDDGSNPVPIWREDPSLLDPLVSILQMPFTTNREAYPEVDPSSPTVYIWPSLMGSDLKDLSAEEQAMLDTLGITDREVRDMIEQFGRYVGPRAGIAEDGTWTFYATGGD